MVLFKLINFILWTNVINYPSLTMNEQWAAILLIISCQHFHAIKKKHVKYIMILDFYLLEPCN